MMNISPFDRDARTLRALIVYYYLTIVDTRLGQCGLTVLECHTETSCDCLRVRVRKMTAKALETEAVESDLSCVYPFA
jgi:hypothetical protein